MFRHLYLFLGAVCLLTGPVNAQSFAFYRTDSVPVLHGTDTLNYAWAGGFSYNQYSRIDMDMDGDKDLFVFERTGDQVLTFEYTGQPGINYKYAPKYESLFPDDLSSWCLLYDYNCDGKEDIFTYTPGGFKVYRNISDTSLKFEVATNLLKSNQLGNFINLYVSSVDIPALYDIDYDGDMDVLTFGLFGKYIEYHKNFSVENGFACDSLHFIMKNECWGCFGEDISLCKINLFDTCEISPFIPGGPEMGPVDNENRALFSSANSNSRLVDPLRSAERHSGSTVMALDMNNQNAADLIVSDISCNNLTLLMNGGTAPNMNTCMVSKDTAFPSNTIPVNIPVFPAAFHVDMDNDNIRDLVVAPNSTVQSNNYNGNWYYKNVGTELSPVFNYITDGFFQNEMFERGEGSIPAFFDHNGDGLLDIVIGNFGFYQANGSYASRLALYQNIGTLSNPSFKLINSDYASVYTQLNKASIIPTFADLDNDNDPDMILGDDDGNIHYFKNIAGSGLPANFTPFQLLMTDNLGSVIDVGQNATPHLVDIDRDGDKDLIIGEKNANLNFYENIGTITNPIFKLTSSNFGNVHVNEFWTTFGYSVPYTYDYNGQYHLFVGSLKGMIYQYNNIDGNLAGNFNLIDSMPDPVNYLGIRTAPATIDLNNNGYPDLIIGNYRGGLTMFSSSAEDTTAISESALNENFVSLFPNPALDNITIKSNIMGSHTAVIFSSDGKIKNRFDTRNNEITINISDYSPGVYFIKLQIHASRDYFSFLKFIKQ